MWKFVPFIFVGAAVLIAAIVVLLARSFTQVNAKLAAAGKVEPLIMDRPALFPGPSARWYARITEGEGGARSGMVEVAGGHVIFHEEGVREPVWVWPVGGLSVRIESRFPQAPEGASVLSVNEEPHSMDGVPTSLWLRGPSGVRTGLLVDSQPIGAAWRYDSYGRQRELAAQFRDVLAQQGVLVERP